MQDPLAVSGWSAPDPEVNEMTPASPHKSSFSLAERGLVLFVALLVLVALGIFTATRIVLALYTGMDSVPVSGWPRFLAMGLWFDVAALCYLLVPFLLYDAAFGNRWRPPGLRGGRRAPWARACGVRLARGARRHMLLAAILLPLASGLFANVDQ